MNQGKRLAFCLSVSPWKSRSFPLIFKSARFTFDDSKTEMKTLTMIEVVLTTLLVISFVAVARMAAWMMRMQLSDPAKAHLLMSRINPIVVILGDVIFFSWLIFTAFYLILLFVHLGAWFFSQSNGRRFKMRLRPRVLLGTLRIRIVDGGVETARLAPAPVLARSAQGSGNCVASGL